MAALLLSFVAGLFTTLNPCVLPVLPAVLAGSLEANRFGPLAVALGLATSFALVGTTVAAVGVGAGVDAEVVRLGAAGLMVAAGVVLLSGVLQMRFAGVLAPVAGRADALLTDRSGDGLRNEVLTGLLLGAIWSPCSGPSLGAAIGLAAEGGELGTAALRMLAFGLGAGTVLVVLAYGARGLLSARSPAMRWLAHHSKAVMGWTFLVVGTLVLTGIDKAIETALVDAMPDWLVDLTTRF